MSLEKNILERLEKEIDKYENLRGKCFTYDSPEEEFFGRVMGLRLATDIVEEEFSKAKDGE